MAKKIDWSREAIENVVAIAEYIEKDSEYYSSVFVKEIYQKADSLKTFSRRGRVVPEILDENTRGIFIGE